MAAQNFEEWLAEYPKRAFLVETLEKQTGRALSEELRTYMVNSTRRNAQQFAATRNWLTRTQGLCHRIAAGIAHEAEYVLLWVYLHGVIHELYEKENARRDFYMQVPWFRSLLEAFDSLRACLTEDERSFVAFMRHNHVHVLVDYPWQRMVVKDGLVKGVKPAYDALATQNAEAVLSRYGGDQMAAAADFVGKTIRAVDALDEAWTTANVF